MKSILTSALLILSASAISAQQENSQTMQTEIQESSELVKVIGKVHQIGDTWLIDVKQNGDIQRYVPTMSAESSKDIGWQEKDLEIVFSGTPGVNPPNVRAMGQPLVLREWTRLYRAQPASNE